MLSLIYSHFVHSEHMSTARERVDLLDILVILLAAVHKLTPPLTNRFFYASGF
jgi:hypothetical protein